MKTSYVLFFLFLSFGTARSQSQSWELDMNNKDTINKIDVKNQKQGIWLIRSSGYGSPPLEKGNYINNRKDGVWEEHYKNGNMRSKLTYANGFLEGPAVFYNTDGKVMKEGNFKGNKWVN